jgi:hypothetical protein
LLTSPAQWPRRAGWWEKQKMPTAISTIKVADAE